LTATKFTQDKHRYPRAGFDFTGVAHDKYTQVRTQLNLFRDARTGVADRLIPNSGFTITHEVWWNADTSKWNHKTTKVGAATTIGGITSTAGGGSTATSSVHVL